MLVSAIHEGDVVGAVEAADVADDLGDGPAELVADGITRARPNLLGLTCSR